MKPINLAYDDGIPINRAEIKCLRNKCQPDVPKMISDLKSETV